ncbi:MAG: hypothetical protein E6I40_03615 [Chloroflexi bacterium]|nr:MAG: hypothetical protein E6I40_03615 [Chloroflexota bacterium]
MPIEVVIGQKLVQCAVQLPARCRARRYAGDTFGERFQKATVIGPDLRARPHGGASSVRLRARRWQRVCMDVAHELDRSADAASRAGHLHRLR